MKRKFWVKKSGLLLLILGLVLSGTRAQAQESATAATMAEESYDGFKLGIDELPGIDDAFSSFSEVSPIDFELGMSLVSAYMWRGQKVGGDTSWQPWVTLSPDFEPIGDLSFTLWVDLTSQPGRNDQEYDYVVDYNFDVSQVAEALGFDPEALPVDANLDVGYIYYQFPISATRSQEIYFGITLDTFLSPSMTWYHDWNLGRGEWIEFAISQDIDLKAFTLATYCKLGYNHKQWTTNGESTFSGLEFGGSIPIPLGEHMSIEPFLSYHKRINTVLVSPGGANLTEDELFGGVNYSIAF